MFIVFTPSLGIKKLSDLIARAKGHPDEISCAVTGIGRLTLIANKTN
jgi:tripartite-type tricarboxylate transporter receptor subunit TctC